MSEKFTPMRHKYEHQGNKIYEWDQTLDEVNIYIQPPKGVTAKMLQVLILPNKLSVGLKGNPPYIDEEFYGTVKHKDSFWTMEDGELHITLSKSSLGDTWTSALKGHAQMDSYTEEQVKKNLMLERFQMEHPGFDFSGAQFSGQAPDPKTFLGGITQQ